MTVDQASSTPPSGGGAVEESCGGSWGVSVVGVGTGSGGAVLGWEATGMEGVGACVRGREVCLRGGRDLVKESWDRRESVVRRW